MDRHPSYALLKPHLSAHPRTAGALFQTYNDITLAQRWTDVRVLDLPGAAGRAGLVGRRPDAETDAYVVPCALAETLSPAWIRAVFDALPPGVEAFFLAIVAEDSSVVYYKLSKGIAKPPL
jgi:tRNA-splicing endonuclease subunit Sen15